MFFNLSSTPGKSFRIDCQSKSELGRTRCAQRQVEGSKTGGGGAKKMLSMKVYPTMLMKTKGDGKAILDGPTMFMKIKVLSAYRPRSL